MDFHYKNSKLFCENISIEQVIKEYGTPCYLYSKKNITDAFNAFEKNLGNYPHQICYAVKANANPAILNLLAQQGAGFDIVSGGELTAAIKAKGNPKKIIFSGVGKSADEIETAIKHKIFCFNIESESEFYRIHHIAKRLKKRVNIALRINPHIATKTHRYISTALHSHKFGIEPKQALMLYEIAKNIPFFNIEGIACHLGSQITELSPFLAALDALIALTRKLKQKNIILQHIDIGGGLGIRYKNETPISIKDYTQALIKKIAPTQLTLILEPGRALMGQAGVLITRIEYLKTTPKKNFAIVDAGMNDLLRPALYSAWQTIQPIFLHQNIKAKKYDVVGPVCETGDFLGKNRILKIQENDCLAIMDVGAYGFVMSSNYNLRPRAAEILVDNNHYFLIREREKI